MVPANFEPDSNSVLSRKPYVPMVFLTYLCQASRELKFCGRFDVCVDCLDDVVVRDVVLLLVFVVFVIVGVVFGGMKYLILMMVSASQCTPLLFPLVGTGVHHLAT